MDVEGLAILGCTEPHVAKLVPDFREVFFVRNRIALLGKIASHYAAADTSELSRIEHGFFQGTPPANHCAATWRYRGEHYGTIVRLHSESTRRLIIPVSGWPP